MQNPKIGLEYGCWYTVAFETSLMPKPSTHAKKRATIRAGQMVYFLGYGKGSVRWCRVICGDCTGWIFVDQRYQKHYHFFQKVNLQQ